jgi:hypothetical protein
MGGVNQEGGVLWIPYGSEVRILCLSDVALNVWMPCWHSGFVKDMSRSLARAVMAATLEYWAGLGKKFKKGLAEFSEFVASSGGLGKKNSN